MKFLYPDGATPIDPDEAEGLIPSLSTQEELNEFEARNIRKGSEWAAKSRRIKNNLLDPATLRLLHQQMFGRTWKWAGNYRKTQKNIGSEAWQISPNLKALIDDAVIWISAGTYPSNEIAARFHHRLVSIHPFQNGNGRFGRLATDLLGQQQGWVLPSWGSGDLVYAGQARADYIKALKAADGHDISQLIKFMWS